MNAVESLPARFETPLERRALLARALVANPRIMILDEATSSIDTETEVLIQGAVDRLLDGRTSIVIAPTIVALAGGVVFGVLAFASWRASRLDGPPLVLDGAGLSFADGLGERCFLPWERIDDVGTRGSGLFVRVVVTLRDEDEAEVAIPPLCLAGVSAERAARLIESYRRRALHAS